MFIDRRMLLGIGVGLLLAATLSAVGGHRSPRLSDVEVVRRAKELGMSFQEEQRLTVPSAPASAAAGGEARP